MPSPASSTAQPGKTAKTERMADAEGYKYQLGERIEIQDHYNVDNVFLTRGTRGVILSRGWSKEYDMPSYQINVSEAGHYHPVLEIAFKE